MTERGEATRKRLLEAAAKVFVERGYAGATTKEIARAAGVAEGTIYRHFADKRELFAAVFAQRGAGDFEAIVRLPELAGAETVRENLLFFVRAIEGVEREVVPLMAAASLETRVASSMASGASWPEGTVVPKPLEHVQRYLEAEQRLGRVREDVDLRAAAFALFAIPFAAVTLGVFRPEARRDDAADVVSAVGLVLEAIVPGAG